jgi:hypothetical protein
VKLNIVKKSLPQTTKVTTVTMPRGTTKFGATNKGAKGAADGGLFSITGTSKNNYKKIRNKYCGQILSFIIDDFVEYHYPHRDTNWMVMGEMPGLEFQHQFKGKLTNVTEEELETVYYDKLCYGKVTHVEWDNTTRTIEFYVEEITRKHPKESKHESKTTVH